MLILVWSFSIICVRKCRYATSTLGVHCGIPEMMMPCSKCTVETLCLLEQELLLELKFATSAHSWCIVVTRVSASTCNKKRCTAQYICSQVSSFRPRACLRTIACHTYNLLGGRRVHRGVKRPTMLCPGSSKDRTSRSDVATIGSYAYNTPCLVHLCQMLILFFWADAQSCRNQWSC